MCPLEDIVGGSTAQWFLSLKGDSIQMHSKHMVENLADTATLQDVRRSSEVIC